MIKILFFGRFSDAATQMECELPEGVSDIKALAAWICSDNAAFAKLYAGKGNRVALNQCFADPAALIQDGDEIAFMSALSGG
jgi:molybdopterin converting factor small subunit